MEIILSCNTVILYPDKTHKLYYVLLLDIMVGMGYSQEEIQESLSKMKYDEITATYLLLGRKSSELDASDSSSSSNLSLAKVRPSSDLNNSTGQSPHHKVQRSVSSSQKQRRYSDHAGPAIPSVVAYPKRSQTSTADSDLKEDGIPSRKSSGSAVGGKGIAPASPMLGNASNPNKADIPERKKSSTVPSVSIVKLESIPSIVGLWRSGRFVPLFSSTCSTVPTRPPCPISASRDHLQYLC